MFESRVWARTWCRPAAVGARSKRRGRAGARTCSRSPATSWPPLSASSDTSPLSSPPRPPVHGLQGRLPHDCPAPRTPRRIARARGGTQTPRHTRTRPITSRAPRHDTPWQRQGTIIHKHAQSTDTWGMTFRAGGDYAPCVAYDAGSLVNSGIVRGGRGAALTCRSKS